jgi:hypothetical protein
MPPMTDRVALPSGCFKHLRLMSVAFVAQPDGDPTRMARGYEYENKIENTKYNRQSDERFGRNNQKGP